MPVHSLVAQSIKYKMGMKLLLFAVVFLLPILWSPAEAGLMSFAAKTLTRLTMSLDARLDPNKDDDVVRRTSIYLVIMEKTVTQNNATCYQNNLFLSHSWSAERDTQWKPTK